MLIMDKKKRSMLLKLQRRELTAKTIYLRIAKSSKDASNRRILEKIAKDELKHYQFWKAITKKEVKPNIVMVYWYIFISNLFGLSFALKFMEKSEFHSYTQFEDEFAGLSSIMEDEQKHEKVLLSMLDEDVIKYSGSVVLGLNDALVELTGALAGLTLALQNGRLVAIAGLIIGIAASMSMAASGYLSSKEEANKNKKPLKSALYTGFAYIVTVILLIIPYLIFRDIYVSLAVMLSITISIIFTYTFYITTAKSLKFWGRFVEMAIISLTVAILSFGVGFLVKLLFGAEI